MTSNTLSSTQAVTLANEHYENFPVSPFFLPKALRQPIALIYAFARVADDIADEGFLGTSERLNRLQQMHDWLPDGRFVKDAQGFFLPLNQMISKQGLPCQLFHDLLDAFMQDCTKSSYQDYEQVLDYCRRSANPIGRLLLHLTGLDSRTNLENSDKICTALQLINFLQDWYLDLTERDRVYIPQDDLATFGLTVQNLKSPSGINLKPLLNLQWQRAHQLLIEGSALTQALRGRFGLNIRLTVWGGATILQKCKLRSVETYRPVLTKLDWLKIVFKATARRPIK